MPVLSDYEVVTGNSVIRVAKGKSFSAQFNSGGRESKLTAFLTLDLQSMQMVKEAVSIIKINGKEIGSLQPPLGPYMDNSLRGKLGGIWLNQTVSFPGSILNDGDNTIVIDVPPTKTGTDTFYIKNVVVFFRQDAKGVVDQLKDLI